MRYKHVEERRYNALKRLYQLPKTFSYFNGLKHYLVATCTQTTYPNTRSSPYMGAVGSDGDFSSTMSHSSGVAYMELLCKQREMCMKC